MQEIHRTSFWAGLITLLVIIVLVGSFWGVRAWLKAESEAPAQPIAQEKDSDGDGLPDIFEEIYRTDPTRHDSDGDGLEDLEEIIRGRDPAIAGPNDESKPLTGSNVENLETLTGQYLASLPEDISRAEILDDERISAFLAERTTELLPTIDPATIPTISETSAATVQAYLEEISASHNAELNTVTNEAIARAVSLQLQLQPQELNNIISQLEHNNSTLSEVSVPAELVPLQTKLLGATRALSDNVKQLAAIDEDFIGGLLAAQNIDRLGAIWQEIADEVVALETQYSLE